MGFEITYTFHPRKDDGVGYDTAATEEQVVKVGKPFDETPLESLAAGIMAQMARRDIWVVDVKVVELVRKEVTFKECKDGRGIMLRNKRFSFNEAAQMVAEDVEEAPQAPNAYPHEQMAQARLPVANGQHPHERLAGNGQHQHPHERLAADRTQNSIEDLYGNPSKPVPVVRQSVQPRSINQKKVLYYVYFDPDPYRAEAQRMKLKFQEDRKYPVHQIVPHPTGKLDAQQLALTDDTGKVVVLEEKYFTSAGVGLLEDKDNRFSGSSARGVRRPKLSYEGEMYMDVADPKTMAAIPQGIPIDDGTLPDELLQVPDIRPGRRVQ